MIRDALTDFLLWFLRQPIGLLTVCKSHPVRINESVTTTPLYTAGVFNVELVSIAPFSKWPGEHCHPDVDSYEVDMFGFDGFQRDGKKVTKPDIEVPLSIGSVNVIAACVRLFPHNYHTITDIGAQGAAVISVQRWLNNVKPTSVGLNWKGLPVSQGHINQLEEKDAVLYAP